jgi:hypothetical protein
MLKSLLFVFALVVSANAHAYTCTASGQTGAFGVGTSPFLPTAQMFALNFCQQNNFGMPCMLMGCNPFSPAVVDPASPETGTEATLTEKTEDVLYPELGSLTGAAFGYGKTCVEASQNALNKNRCYHGTGDWKMTSCTDSVFFGKRSVVTYTCSIGGIGEIKTTEVTAVKENVLSVVTSSSSGSSCAAAAGTAASLCNCANGMSDYTQTGCTGHGNWWTATVKCYCN